jgi:hypothetical protein
MYLKKRFSEQGHLAISKNQTFIESCVQLSINIQIYPKIHYKVKKCTKNHYYN